MDSWFVLQMSGFGFTAVIGLLTFMDTRSRSVSLLFVFPFYLINCFWSLGKGVWWEGLPFVPILLGLVYCIYKLLCLGKDEKVNSK
jgi:hypothetical protein